MSYKNKRIIARIDTKNNKAVKGICYEGYSVVGDIKDLLKKYYELGVHEIIMIDTIASLNNRNVLKEFIFENTKNIFIPITICGGLKSEEDIDSMLKAGADKIGINKVAIQNPESIKNDVLLRGDLILYSSMLRLWEGEYVRIKGYQREISNWCLESSSNFSNQIKIDRTDWVFIKDKNKFIDYAESVILTENKSEYEKINELILIDSLRGLLKNLNSKQISILKRRFKLS